MLIFTAPWALLLLGLLPATALASRARLRRLPGRRGALVLTLRLLVLGLLATALAGPQWRTRTQRVAVMFLVDASASVGAAGQRTGMTWTANATATGGPRDEAGMILFGAAPRGAPPRGPPTTPPPPPPPADGATDIGAATRLGLSLLPPDMPGRLVLLSDGRDTTDATAPGGAGLPDGAALALARGVPIDIVPIAPPRRRDALVRAIDLPRVMRVGERVPLRITLSSADATNALLTVWTDGQETRQTVRLRAGDTVLGAEERLLTPGLHTVRVRVDAPGDTIPQNNVLDAATVVGPVGRVLLATTDPAAASPLAAALTRAGIAVHAIRAGALPATTSGYAGYDEAVLDDVPATAMSAAQQRALRDRAYLNGLGLLVVGGPDAFSAGDYAHTPLEEALPVYSVSLPRRLSDPLALDLVIDKSGSMADDVAGVAKVDMVKVAAASALDKLGDGDAVGVLAFDDANHVIVPFHALQGAADKARMRRQIAGLSAEGDTYIYPALQAAERDVTSVNTAYRHIVLLTDGQGEQDKPFDTLIARMRREHITLSTIGVGQDVVQDELKRWAKLGGGRFHYVSDPHDIPRIIVGETRYGATGNSAVRGRIRLGVAAASPLLRALAQSGATLPPIGGYDSTAPKTTAQVSVQSANGDPVLSSWQYGLGRVVTWASDSGANEDWAGAWSATRLPLFWTDAVRWTMRGYTPSTTVPNVQVRDGALQISLAPRAANGGFDDTESPRVRVVGPDGVARVVALPLTAPGLYASSAPLSGPGVYAASLVRNDRGPGAPADLAALAVPYPAEYADDGVDTALLTHLTSATGGHVLARPADAFAHDGLPAADAWNPLWPLLLALALLLFPLDIAARLLVPPDPRYRRRV